MTDTTPLASLGWAPDFLRQLTLDELSTLSPCRISAVHRARLEALGATGPLSLSPAPGLCTAEIAVGDWALYDGTRLVRLLERRATLARRAAGTGAARQLIAANVDTLFLTTSCNADFNPARIERYLALARASGVTPVIVLTKADESPEPEAWQARAEAVDRRVAVVALDARAPGERLADWARAGQTVALLGSSGVGKTTLANALTGEAQATAPIRADDAKGRHTTTGRHLRALVSGGWLIDTPGMRELRLSGAEAGIAATFDDLDTLARACRFHDCTHQTEPGCAVQGAIAAGAVDPARLLRWQKLQREDRINSETLAETHARDRAFDRMKRGVLREKSRLRGE